MKSFFKRLGNNIYDGIKSTDMYGQQINLQFMGEDKFKTFLGGIGSIVVYIFIFFYSGYLLNIMLKRETIVYTTNSVIRDLTVDSKDHYPAQKNFSLAIGWSSPIDLLSEEGRRYAELEIYQFTSVADGIGSFKNTYTCLDFER